MKNESFIYKIVKMSSREIYKLILMYGGRSKGLSMVDNENIPFFGDENYIFKKLSLFVFMFAIEANL